MLTVIATSVKETRDSELETQFPADYEVRSAVSDRPLTTSLLDQIAATPGVAVAGGETRLSLTLGEGDTGRWSDMAAVTPASLGTLIRPEVVRGSLSSLRDNGIVLTEEMARRVNADVGSTLTGSVESVSRTLRVIAVIKPAGGADSFTDRALWPGDGVDTIAVQTEAGADGRAVLDAATRGVPTAKVVSFADVRAEFTARIDQLLAFVWAMIGLAVLTALFGIANTMTLSVIERTWESALLRALGFTRAQLRRMLVVESSLIALTGAVLGAVAGGAAAVLLVLAVSQDDDLRMVVSVPFGQLAVLFVAVGIAGVLAAVLPARRAASASIVAGMAE